MTLKPGIYTPEEAEAARQSARDDPLTPDQVRQLLRESVTVVKPGETLILRGGDGWTPQQVREVADHATWWLEANAPHVKVLVVPPMEIAVVEHETDETFAERLDRVLPGRLEAFGLDAEAPAP